MNEEFVSEGLDADRYLKADKLVSQFEGEIREALEDTLEDLIDDHENLFEEDSGFSYAKFGTDNSNTLSTIRVESDLIHTHDEHGSLKQNVGVEWVNPDNQDIECFNASNEATPSLSKGSLCYALYKIQRGSVNAFETVKQRTREADEWDEICFGQEKWATYNKQAPGIVCVLIETGSELTEGLRTLKHHFSEVYAPELR